MQDELTRKINAELDALGAIDNETLAAVQKLKSDEAQLEQSLLDGELTDNEHFALWFALRKRTPREVQLASLKITKTLAEALKKDLGASDA